MWYCKNISFDLSDSMTEEKMEEFWFELDKQREREYIDSLAMTYELVD